MFSWQQLDKWYPRKKQCTLIFCLSRLPRSPAESPMLILSWTKQSGSKSELQDWIPFGDDAAFAKCTQLDPHMKCRYTSDRAQFNRSNAVLFRGRRLMDESLPGHRLPHQKWIFFEYEPPFKVWTRADLTPFKRIFNLTSTYSYDSNIPMNLRRNVTIGPNKLYHLKQTNVTYHQNKSRLIAWFVSVCKTQSQREEYVNELQRHIPVDIYGQCGPLKCGASRNQLNRSYCDYELLSAPGSYKFYLSFENSLCDDYVTEKLWRLLKQDVLQIVMGGVDYSTLLPPKSYLNVADFSSPKALAAFIKHLDNNNDEYNDYVRRKKSIKIDLLEVDEPYYCRLCRYLHLHKHQKQIVPDISKFWGLHTRCYYPGKFFKKSSRGVTYRNITKWWWQ